MEKHIGAKTKYHYVMKYLNGGSPTKLSLEINPQLKNLTYSILRWYPIYQKEEEVKGLESKTGKMKGLNKRRPKKTKTKIWTYE